MTLLNLSPKVLFDDQHGHHVAHNPGTLEVLDKKGHD